MSALWIYDWQLVLRENIYISSSQNMYYKLQQTLHLLA